jgi:hypothetical protein
MRDGFQVRLQFKLRENDRLITAVSAGMADDHEGIDVALWEKAEGNFGAWGFRSPAVAVALLECFDLEGIGDYVAVGDHDPFLFAN